MKSSSIVKGVPFIDDINQYSFFSRILDLSVTDIGIRLEHKQINSFPSVPK